METERRGFLSAIGMAFVGVPQIKAVELKPGQVFVIECDREISRAAVQAIKNSWVQCWGEDKAPTLLILTKGMTLKTVEAGNQ